MTKYATLMMRSVFRAHYSQG